MVRHDGVVWGYSEVADMGPDGLGHKTVVDDTSYGSRLICVLALGVTISTAIEDGEISVAAEL